MSKLSVEDKYFHFKNSIKIGNKLFSLEKPVVMGIINCTPDSFHADSRFEQINSIVNQCQKLVNEGAKIIDIGGYSTRPDATKVTESVEIERVIPTILAIRAQFPDLIISVDTFRAKVAEAAILAGADIINDISGFEIEPELLTVLAKYQKPYILMHMQGGENTMHENKENSLLLNEIMHYFSKKIALLHANGIYDIIIDPGFGFSKTMEQNFEVLDKLELFQALGQPILAGLSRKRMIWSTLNITPNEALNGTTALNAKAILKGASILRVHDVKEAQQVIHLLTI